MSNRILISLVITGIISIPCFVFAQPPGRGGPPGRTHKIIEKGTLRPLPATEAPPTENEVSITVKGDQRVIVSNGIPNHKTGQFPNRGNPNRIRAQRHEYRVPANPKIAEQVSPMHGEFGVALNGVPFDPGAAEFYDGEPGWQYEPLSGAVSLGIDSSHAHVQPTGKYHYHGLPTGLIESTDVKAGAHSPLIGWAADGFPIYAVYGYDDPRDANSPVKALRSSFRLKSGDRPGGNAPGGKYDGTFVKDYEYFEGAGDLDECNGRFTITPEFPDGTYAYFLTENWPVVPRNYRGTPSDDFRHGPGPGGPEGRRQGTEIASGDGARNPLGWFGGMPPGEPPRPGQILPSHLIDRLNLNDQQRDKLRKLQSTVDKELKQILTPEQHRQLEAPPQFGRDPGPPRRRLPQMNQRSSRPR